MQEKPIVICLHIFFDFFKFTEIRQGILNKNINTRIFEIYY